MAPPAAAIEVQHGEKPERLIVAFSGFRDQLMMPMFDFFGAARALRCSRILLFDETRTAFTAGIPSVARGREALTALLREKIAELAPRTTVFVGASGGGHAALSYGHALAPDIVHAFSPFTYGDSANIARYNDRELGEGRAEVLERIRAHGVNLDDMDLARVMRTRNGRTRYFVHACRRSTYDAMRAKHLREVPRVKVLLYSCGSHAVLQFLARQRMLMRLLAEDPVAWLREASASRE